MNHLWYYLVPTGCGEEEAQGSSKESDRNMLLWEIIKVCALALGKQWLLGS